MAKSMGEKLAKSIREKLVTTHAASNLDLYPIQANPNLYRWSLATRRKHYAIVLDSN